MSGKTVWVVSGLVLAIGTVAYLGYHDPGAGKDALGTIAEAKRDVSGQGDSARDASRDATRAANRDASRDAKRDENSNRNASSKRQCATRVSMPIAMRAWMPITRSLDADRNASSGCQSQCDFLDANRSLARYGLPIAMRALDANRIYASADANVTLSLDSNRNASLDCQSHREPG